MLPRRYIEKYLFFLLRHRWPVIVVIGGMITTLFLTRYLMPLLYSFYGHREPSAEASRMAH